MVTTTRRVTLEELERDGGPDGCWEVIDGELVKLLPSDWEQGLLGVRIARFIGNFVAEHQLGYVFGADGGVVLVEEPLTLRAPKISFIQHHRVWQADFDDDRFLRVVPDLTVEILSRFGHPVEVLGRVVTWLKAGVAMVWLIDANEQTVTVFGPDVGVRVMTIEQTLDGGGVLPGFRLPIWNIFARSWQ